MAFANEIGDVITRYSYYDYIVTKKATAVGSTEANRGEVRVKIKSAYMNYSYNPSATSTYVEDYISGSGWYYYNVTSFEGCCENMKKLEYINIDNIPTSITSMKNCCKGCDNLRYLYNANNFSTRLSKLVDMSGCFSGCNHFTNYYSDGYNRYNISTLPATVTNMSDTFYGCTSLSVAPTIPANVTNMSGCFGECISLTTAPTIPNNVQNLSRCFINCTGITSPPSIPSKVTNMSQCFSGCSQMTAVPTLPATLTDASYCFAGCGSIADAPVIPANVTNIESMFSGCGLITNMPTIPAKVTNMTQAFYYCYSITGDVTVNATSISKYSGMFLGTQNDIFLVPGSGADTTHMKAIANEHGNVHYDTSDNPRPSVDNVVLMRVGSNNSKTENVNGTWLYIDMAYVIRTNLLPRSKKTNQPIKITITLDDNSSKVTTITTGFSPTTYDEAFGTKELWISLGNTEQHVVSIVIDDKYKTSDTYRGIISGAFATMDFHAGGDGVGIGQFATAAGFYVNMNSSFAKQVAVNGKLDVYNNNLTMHNGKIIDKNGAEITPYHLEIDGNTLKLVPGTGTMSVVVPAVWR